MALFRRKQGARSPGIKPVWAGVIAAVVIVIAVFFGFTRFNPFASPYTISAVFQSANNITPGSPVREAGVDVGQVNSVSSLSNGAAKVTMQITSNGLPLHSDAQFKIRPRIFLEGNFFVDVSPGSPDAPKVKSGYTIPVNQTATPVQFDQVLSSLQADTRQSLQTLLKEYAEKGLGNGGAEAYNKGLDSAPGAEQYSSIVNQASLGEQPHDLSNLLRGQQRLFASLSSNPQALEDLITQLNTTANAFAVQDVALSQTIPSLRDTLRAANPALVSLNNALPALRTFSIEALPGVRSSGPTIDASLPEITQLRHLISPAELEGLVRDLRPTIPALARLNQQSIALLAENRALSACQNNVLLPFAQTPIPNPDFAGLNGRPFYKLAPQGLEGLAGESRLNDANTPVLHVNGGSGATTVILTNRGTQYFAQAPTPPQGTRPARPAQRPNFRPGTPCELQQVPDMNAPEGTGFQSVTQTGGIGGLLPPLPLPLNKRLAQEGQAQANELKFYVARQQQHQPAIDPMTIPQSTYVQEMKRIGFSVDSQGHPHRMANGTSANGAGG